MVMFCPGAGLATKNYEPLCLCVKSNIDDFIDTVPFSSNFSDTDLRIVSEQNHPSGRIFLPDALKRAED